MTDGRDEMDREANRHGRPGCGDEVAAYALGALEPAEVAAFEAHLETCVVCRDEVAAFRHVVETLPAAAPAYRAPTRLRRRVLAAVAAEPRGEQPAASEQRRRVSGLMTLRLPRPAVALATLAAAVVLVIGGAELSGSSASRTHVYAATVFGSHGSAQLDLTGAHAELIVHHMAAPAAGKIYEVWLQRPGQTLTPTTALFSVTTAGDGDVDVPGSLHGVSEVLVTPEPAGGSRVPTHAPVIRAELT